MLETQTKEAGWEEIVSLKSRTLFLMFPDGVVLMMVRIADPGESNEKQQCVRCFPTVEKKVKDEGVNTGYFHKTLSHRLWD